MWYVKKEKKLCQMPISRTKINVKYIIKVSCKAWKNLTFFNKLWMQKSTSLSSILVIYSFYFFLHGDILFKDLFFVNSFKYIII